jgi:very-short-patch-repair endonuclease
MDKARFEAVLAAQRGVFTRNQALDCGFSPAAAARSAREGMWRPVAGRGFCLPDTPIGILQDAWGAFLSVPRCTIWGPSALKLRLAAAPLPPCSKVLAAAPGRGHQGEVRQVVVRRMAIRPLELGQFEGLPAQTLASALVDSLAYLAPNEADGLFAWALARDLISPDTFDGLVQSRRRSRGVVRLRRYAEQWRAGAGSLPEFILQGELRSRGVAGWEANARVTLPGGNWARVDLLFRARRLVVEVDGQGPHSEPDVFRRDRIRQNGLSLAGYRILRFTAMDAMRRPSWCVDQMVRMLT